MPRAKRFSKDELEVYAKNIAYYRSQFLRLGGRTDLCEAVNIDGENLVVWSESTVRSFNLFTPKTVSIVKTFTSDGIGYWPKDEEKLNQQLETFRQEVVRFHRNQVLEPSPILPTLVMDANGNTCRAIFQMWVDCIRVYEAGTPFSSAASSTWNDTSKNGEKKASRYYKMAVKYIQQAINGTFPQ